MAGKIRIGRLETAQDISRYIARCIKKAERGGEGDALRWYGLTTMSAVLLKAIEASTFENRIRALEGLNEERTVI